MWGSGKVHGWYMGTGGNAENYAVSFSAENLRHDDTGETQSAAMMMFGTADADRNYGQKGTIEVDENTQLDESLRQHIKTTPAQAKALVESFLQQTNRPMAVCAMALVNDEETDVYDGVVAPAGHYAYRVACIRMVEGVLPCARIEGAIHVQTNKPAGQGEFTSGPGLEAPGGYMKQWEYETMGFMVSDAGIISMNWRAPLEPVETVVAESTLMPFSEIQSIFEKMMPITFEATSKGMDNLTCSVGDVRLEMMRVVEQSSVENGLLIPVWNFYGIRSRTHNGKTDQTGRYILMCINAVDGSVIDISQGY